MIPLQTAIAIVLAGYVLGWLAGFLVGWVFGPLSEVAMPRSHSCRRWRELAAKKAVRESTGSGRLVIVEDHGLSLPKSCPFCGAAFYRQIGNQHVLSPAGDAHREAVRDERRRAGL